MQLIKKISIAGCLYGLSIGTSDAQVFADTTDNTVLLNSGKLISEGIAAYDTGNYKRALSLFSTVPEGDSNYNLALYESALALVADSNYTDAINTIENAVLYPSADKHALLLLKASALDYKGQTDDASSLYRILGEKSPNDHRPWFELGLVFYRKEMFDSAIHFFEKALLINAGHFKSHQLLGLTYARQGRLTEAAIALQSALLYAPNSASAELVISFLYGLLGQNDFYSNAYAGKKEKYKNPAYEEMDELIHAKLILNENYKVKSVLDDEQQAKMTYAILEKVKYDVDNENFVMQFYMPLWNRIHEEKKTDYFLIFLYSGYGFEKIQKLYTKEKGKVDALKEEIYSYMNNITATRTVKLKDRDKARHRYIAYNGNGYYYDAVLNEKNQIQEGDATIYLYGNLYGKGRYNNAGNREGLWTYYYTGGKRKSEENYKDGKLVGELKTWYENGQPKSISRYNEKNISVYYKGFNRFGAPTEEYELIREKPEQLIRKTTFYENGNKRLNIILKGKDYEDGSYQNLYENGKVSSSFSIVNGKLNGEGKSFYEDGKPKEKYNYLNGELDGAYEAYHKAGQIRIKSTYKAGKLEDLYESWDDSGMVVSKQSYKAGKLHGKKYYYDKGQEYGFIRFENENPKEWEFKTLDGTLVSENKDLNPSKFIVYYSNGNLKTEAPLKEGKMWGWAKFYAYPSELTEESEYQNDKVEGQVKKFYYYGDISSSYKMQDGNAEGLFTSYYTNKQINTTGYYLKGEKQGKWNYYHINGKPYKTTYYENGSIEGYDIEYNINGELSEKDFYFQGGIYRCIQADSLGNILRDNYFENGNGTYTLYTQGVKYPRFECPLVAGRLHGAYIRKLPDGTITETAHYAFGKRNGTIERLSAVGNKTLSGTYNKGDREGLWTEYHPATGEKTVESYYEDDDLQGLNTYYYPENTRYEFQYKDGNLEGPNNIYFGGELALVLYYHNGYLTGYSYLDSNKKPVPVIALKNCSGTIKSYYPNGKPSAELHYQKNRMTDEQKYYYANGNLAEERNYRNGKLSGTYKMYFMNGKTRIVIDYLDSDPHGRYEEYDKEGKIIFSIPHYYGAYHGTMVLRNTQKNTMKKINYRYGRAVSVE